jgi:hypothetical protein
MRYCRYFCCCLLSVCWLTSFGPATAQDFPPPAFTPYAGPTIAFPGTSIGFSVIARSFQTNWMNPRIQYDLLAAPTNVSAWPVTGRPDELGFWIEWDIPSGAAVGTTNGFVIRASDQGTPPLSSTLELSFILVDPPPIQAIVISNGAPVLQLSDPLAVQPDAVPWHSYRFLWSADLTNWSPLCTVWPDSPLVTVADTNGLCPQRFYRVVNYGWYIGIGAP